MAERIARCPDCGREWDAAPITCSGSFSRHARHPERVCVVEPSEAEIQAAAAALKPYLDKAEFSEVVGDDHDIAAAVLRAATHIPRGTDAKGHTPERSSE